MRNMERFKYVAMALCILCVLQGCDMVRGALGMPTSEDIALMKEELQAIDLPAPVAIGDVVIADVCGTGVNVVAARTM